MLNPEINNMKVLTSIIIKMTLSKKMKIKLDIVSTYRKITPTRTKNWRVMGEDG